MAQILDIPGRTFSVYFGDSKKDLDEYLSEEDFIPFIDYPQITKSSDKESRIS